MELMEVEGGQDIEKMESAAPSPPHLQKFIDRSWVNLHSICPVTPKKTWRWKGE
jgi:hypothetical protein